MKDLTSVISQLKNIKGEITNKDLFDMGLNQYFIKKLEDEGVLYKISRGKYEYSGAEENELDETPRVIEPETDLKELLEEEATEIVEENIPRSTSSYIDENVYQEYMQQIDSYINNKIFNALGFYLISVASEDDKMWFNLETYIVEKLHEKGYYDEAEVFCKELSESKSGAAIVLKIKSDKKKND